MAHNFKITKQTKREECAYFFGYCGGAMYKAFKHPECDAGISGRNKRFIICKEEAERGLGRAIELFDKSNYPDPHRIDEIKEFKISLMDDDKDLKYEIWFA